MRALILLLNFVVIAAGYYFASLLGLLIALGVCVALCAVAFVFSTSLTDARESKELKRAMGRNTTIHGRLD